MVAALVPIREGALECLIPVRALLTGRDHLRPVVVDVPRVSLVHRLLDHQTIADFRFWLVTCPVRMMARPKLQHQDRAPSFGAARAWLQGD